MLPKVVASLDYAGRDNYSGGTSKSLLTGRTSLEPSTSSDRNVLAGDLSLSWDVLDFGLSYVRAKQASDEVSVAEERKRKVVNRIIEDVRTAYWRAVSAQRLLGKIDELEKVTQTALEQAQKQEKAGLTAPLAPLSYQRELLSIRREAQNLGRELSVAKQQLAALMNLAPDTTYQIAMPSRTLAWKPFALPGNNVNLLQTAIENRPELREVAYQLRGNDREETAAYLRALPSLRLFAGADVSSNSFLYSSNWLGWGARASWNLLNVFRLPAEQAKVKAQGQLLDQRALALTTAAATQVEVSRARYTFRLRELDTAQNYYTVQDKIEKQIDAGFKAEKLSRQTLIREQMNTLVSEVRYDMALADLQNAYAIRGTDLAVEARVFVGRDGVLARVRVHRLARHAGVGDLRQVVDRRHIDVHRGRGGAALGIHHRVDDVHRPVVVGFGHDLHAAVRGDHHLVMRHVDGLGAARDGLAVDRGEHRLAVFNVAVVGQQIQRDRRVFAGGVALALGHRRVVHGVDRHVHGDIDHVAMAVVDRHDEAVVAVVVRLRHVAEAAVVVDHHRAVRRRGVDRVGQVVAIGNGDITVHYTVSDDQGGRNGGTLHLQVVSGGMANSLDYPFVFWPQDTARGDDGGAARGAAGFGGDTSIVHDAVNAIDSLHGTPSIDAEGAVLKAVNGVKSLSGTQVLRADGAVLQAVNGVDSLGGIDQGGQSALQRHFDASRSQDGFDASGAMTSLRLPGNVHLELYTRGAQSWIDVSEASASGKSDITHVNASQVDGKALPSWIRVDGHGYIAIDRPAGADLLRLRITVERRGGVAMTHVIEIDSNANEMRAVGEPAKGKGADKAQAGGKRAAAAASMDFAGQLAQASRGQADADAELMALLG
ncbi:MAG TPA: TolC family protein [Variovorax sp.]|nr:TolC family protein [Variovorax sp.]